MMSFEAQNEREGAESDLVAASLLIHQVLTYNFTSRTDIYNLRDGRKQPGPLIRHHTGTSRVNLAKP